MCPTCEHGTCSMDPPHVHVRNPISISSPPQMRISGSYPPRCRKKRRLAAKRPPHMTADPFGSSLPSRRSSGFCASVQEKLSSPRPKTLYLKSSVSMPSMLGTTTRVWSSAMRERSGSSHPGVASMWLSRQTMTSPRARQIPSMRADISPRRSPSRTRRTFGSARAYSSSSSRKRRQCPSWNRLGSTSLASSTRMTSFRYCAGDWLRTEWTERTSVTKCSL
mmetsp:Transcript_55644/g.158465  ORF Transcript_55644/g.158465 Transcript_55644/m.158465 type:complete len:221 (+) Transcript_55644:907-1569(+)